jgi:uncharacterized Zn finger protein (UPF0148 family)
VTVAEFRKLLNDSRPCSRCGCRLLEISSEDGSIFCPRCLMPYVPTGNPSGKTEGPTSLDQTEAPTAQGEKQKRS